MPIVPVKPPAVWDQVDIGVVSTTGSLDWLNAWTCFQPYNIVVVCDNNQLCQAPTGFNKTQIITRTNALGTLKLSETQFSSWDLLLLLCKKSYVFVLDEDCTPATVRYTDANVFVAFGAI